MNKLTPKQLQRAFKIAGKGLRELTISEMKALEAANKAHYGFRPLAEGLTNNQKKRLLKGGK